MKLRPALIACSLSLFVALLARADTVVLKDGTRIEGDVKKIDGGWRVTTADGKTIELAAEKVKGIEVGKGGQKGSPEQAMSNLQSLRRSAENVGDVNEVIARFKRFIEQYKDTPAAAEAKKDLAVWQDRLDRGLVKLGGRWVTPDERTRAADNAQVVAEQAKPLVLSGRLHDAEPLVQQALDADPQCIPALYLRGVIAFKLNQVPAARKAFESVALTIADHAPTYNNLGVILWRQNALMPALAQFEKAITAMPMNKTLLDNCAEILAAVSEGDRKNPVAQRLFRKFVEQDKQLQQMMAADGWYRWGGTWIDRAAMERLKDQETKVNEKLATAKGELEETQRRAQEIDAELQSIEERLRAMEADSYVRDSDGRIIRLPLPAQYYDLQGEQTKLKSERRSLESKFFSAKAQVQQLQDQLPRPKFTGVAQLVGAEGTPVMMAPGMPPPAPEPSTNGVDAPSTAPTQP